MRLRPPEKQAQQHHQCKALGVRGAEHAECAEQRAADKEGTPTACVRQAACKGPQDKGGNGKGSEREPGSRLVRTDWPSHPERKSVDRDADGSEVRDVSNRSVGRRRRLPVVRGCRVGCGP